MLKLAMIAPQIPFKIVMPVITINTVFTHEVIPLSPNRDTVSEEPDPFPNAGISSSITGRISITLQMSEMYLSANSLFSFSATEIISSEQIRSSMVTEKKRAISFSESMLGYPLPDSHLDTAVLETKIACASSSCVSPLPFLNSCSFSLLPAAIRQIDSVSVEQKQSHAQENSADDIRCPVNACDQSSDHHK